MQFLFLKMCLSVDVHSLVLEIVAVEIHICVSLRTQFLRLISNFLS
jgi:hypothetical protein